MSDEKKQNVDEIKESKTHIYLVIDTTSSMVSYIESLNKVLDQILTMINILFAGKTALHCIQYKDYSDATVISQCHDNNKMKQWVRDTLTASGGGDYPEAAKTALNVLYEYIINENGTDNAMDNAICLVYTDASPHHPKMGSNQNLNREREALQNKKPGFDWLDICAAFKKMNLPFYTFVDVDEVDNDTKSFWKLLGHVIEMPDDSIDTINRATIGVFNQIIGANEHAKFKYADNFKLLQYMDNALDILANDYNKLKVLNELSSKGLVPGDQKLADWVKVDFADLPTLVFLADNLKNLPMKLLYDKEFLDTVFREFTNIMTRENVDSFSYNSVFSTMWRYLCRFKDDPRLKALKAKLFVLVNTLNGRNKDVMNEWILESERQLKLEIERTEREVAKAKDIGKAMGELKKSIKRILRQLTNDKNMIVNNVKVVNEIHEIEEEAKRALNRIKEMTSAKNPTVDIPDEKDPNIIRAENKPRGEAWKNKKLKKWKTEDVLDWIYYIGVPPKWRDIMINGVRDGAVTGRDISSLESGENIGVAFGISDAPKLCDAIHILIEKLKYNARHNISNNENRFKINIFSQSKSLTLKQTVTKNDKIYYVKRLYKKQSNVVAPITDIHFYSRSNVLGENQTLEQVKIIDERHLISVKFGADAGNKKNDEPPRCICSKLLKKTKLKSCTNHGHVSCDHCHDTIHDKGGEYAYHCTNEANHIHSKGYDVCTECAEHRHEENENESDDTIMNKMMKKAEKRIMRLNELDILIESNLENDINPKTEKIEANIADSIYALDAITDEGAYGEVQRVKNECNKELENVQEFAATTQELGKKVKKIKHETTEIVQKMKKAQLYLQTKNVTLRLLDGVKSINDELQTDKKIIMNNGKIINEIKRIENDQQNITNEITQINAINTEMKEIKIDSFDEFENECKEITDIDNKVNNIVNKVETQMSRCQELSAKIENNLKMDIKPKIKNIVATTNDQISELDTITEEKVPCGEVDQWKNEFHEQSEIAQDFVAENESLLEKVKGFFIHLTSNHGTIKKKQIEVERKKAAYDKIAAEVEISRLVAKKAAFEESTSNHRGQILAMVSAPNKYEMATSAKDKTVKLWKVNLNENQKLIPFFNAKIEGVALSLAYNKKGSYLAAGCAYQSGAEGVIIVWDTNSYEVKCVFSSTVKLRFSKVHCVVWSNDGKYIFSGDTTGIIWVWDFKNKVKLAKINAHKDVVNDICISPINNALFSCSLDQTISVFNLNKLKKKKNKKLKSIKSKRFLNRAKRANTMYQIGNDDEKGKKHGRTNSSNVRRKNKMSKSKMLHFKSESMYKVNSRPMYDSSDDEKKEDLDENAYSVKQLVRNDIRYAFWNVIPTQDGSHIIAASRKLHCWKFSGFNKKKNLNDSNLEKGIRISDSDFEHIGCLEVQKELICVSRKGKNKVKIFNTTNGKLTLQKRFKGPVEKVAFLFDSECCVVCVQKTDAKNADKNNKKLTYKRPAMYVWHYQQK